MSPESLTLDPSTLTLLLLPLFSVTSQMEMSFILPEVCPTTTPNIQTVRGISVLFVHLLFHLPAVYELISPQVVMSLTCIYHMNTST